jgi:hypothetical protein
MGIAFLLLALVTSAYAQSDDQKQIEHLMRQTWERPDAPLRLEPIVIEGGFAMVGWVQHERGGRGLLRKIGNEWRVVLCSGDPLLEPETVVAVGAPKALADALVAKVKSDEASLPPEHRAKFSLFQGILNIEKGDAHGPNQPHGHAKH